MAVDMMKYVVLFALFIVLCGGTIGTGILFAGFIIAASKNPDEFESLFNYTLIGFALIETFVFFAFIISGLVFFLL
jgi:F0F1-type ATP synthase membrane subunit c/vacuolar-type H+-ATPase subunit K